MTYYFIGIKGSGMSALAQVLRARGYNVCGSDRSFDQGKDIQNKNALENLGIKIFKQDGSAIDKNTNFLYVSTAVEDSIPDVKKALEGMLTPELREKILGYAQIRNVFNITGVGKVAGCMVTEGLVKRGAKIRLLRDNVVIHDGNLGQLKRYKDDVKEVKEGYECGMSFENYNDIQVNDNIECYEVEEIAKTL